MTGKPRARSSYYGYCMAAILAVGAGMHAVQYKLDSGLHGAAEPLRIPLSQFPTQIGDWHAMTTGLDPAQLAILHFSDFWSATYQDSRGGAISLLIGYYPDEAVGKLHQPTICYPGHGWTLDRSGPVRLFGEGPPDGGIEANRLFFTKGENQQIVLYWFHVPGAAMTNPTLSKLNRLASLFHGEFTRSIVKVQVGIPVTDSEEAALRRSQPFLRIMLNRLAEYLGPHWIDLQRKTGPSGAEGGVKP